MSIFRPTDPPRPLRSETGCPTDRPSRPPATARDPTRVTRPTDSPTPSRRRLAGSEPPTDRPSQKPPRDADITFNFASPLPPHCRLEAPPATIAAERWSSFEALTPRPRAPDGCACVAAACARRPRSVRALAVIVTSLRDEVSSTPTAAAIAGARSRSRPRRRSRRRPSPTRSGTIEADT